MTVGDSAEPRFLPDGFGMAPVGELGWMRALFLAPHDEDDISVYVRDLRDHVSLFLAFDGRHQSKRQRLGPHTNVMVAVFDGVRFEPWSFGCSDLFYEAVNDYQLQLRNSHQESTSTWSSYAGMVPHVRARLCFLLIGAARESYPPHLLEA